MAESSASTPSAVPSTPAAAAPVAKPAVTGNTGAGAVPQAKPEAAKAPVADDSWEVQIDGRVERKSRKEILEAYQLRQLSDKKRAEAEKVLTEYSKVFETSKKDPIKFLKAMGVDFDQLSTSYLSKKAEEAMMDPKERELQAARKEADEYKKYVAEQKAAQEKSAKEAEVSASRQQIHSEIISAIEEAKDSLGLPVDEELIIAVAQKMLLQDAKQKPLNAKEALPKAYESQQKYLRSMAAKMEGEALVKWLGDDVAKKIRKYDLQRLKAKRGVPAPQARVEAPKVDNAAAKPYKTWSQFKAERLDTIK
jgi:hypothetical protein